MVSVVGASFDGLWVVARVAAGGSFVAALRGHVCFLFIGDAVGSFKSFENGSGKRVGWK